MGVRAILERRIVGTMSPSRPVLPSTKPAVAGKRANPNRPVRDVRRLLEQDPFSHIRTDAAFVEANPELGSLDSRVLRAAVTNRLGR